MSHQSLANFMSKHYRAFFFFFSQGFTLARQVLYCLSHFTSPNFYVIKHKFHFMTKKSSTQEEIFFPLRLLEKEYSMELKLLRFGPM
jgi:hypothetical protein